MKKMKLAITTLFVTVTVSVTAFAGTWQQDTTGWAYQNDAGSFYNNGWQWIDGNGDGVAECYYFTPDGHCLINTVTPDNYLVNANGAWIVENVIQVKSLADATAVPPVSNNIEESQATNTAADQSAGSNSYSYATGMSDDPTNCNYVVNTNTHKIHYPSCSSVKDIFAGNRKYFIGSFATLTASGYSSCGRCHAK